MVAAVAVHMALYVTVFTVLMMCKRVLVRMFMYGLVMFVVMRSLLLPKFFPWQFLFAGSDHVDLNRANPAAIDA